MARRAKKVRARKVPPAAAAAPTRRDGLRRMAWIGGGAALLALGGGAFALDFRERLAETDLSRIGGGLPAIVQVHDPQCPMCRELQREARAALDGFDADGFVYLVANIRSTEGAEFARAQGLPHVTLALFDAGGDRVEVVRGVTPRAELSETFRRRLRLAAE